MVFGSSPSLPDSQFQFPLTKDHSHIKEFLIPQERLNVRSGLQPYHRNCMILHTDIEIANVRGDHTELLAVV